MTPVAELPGAVLSAILKCGPLAERMDSLKLLQAKSYPPARIGNCAEDCIAAAEALIADLERVRDEAEKVRQAQYEVEYAERRSMIRAVPVVGVPR